MGCDIHLVVERRIQGDPDWIGIYASDNAPGGRPKIAQRNYEFFAEVAGVRGSSATTTYARNLPRDVSRLAWINFMACPTDYHHPSHLTVTEFIGAWRRANPNDESFREQFCAYDLLGVDSDWPEAADYRVVFWFDN